MRREGKGGDKGRLGKLEKNILKQRSPKRMNPATPSALEF